MTGGRDTARRGLAAATLLLLAATEAAGAPPPGTAPAVAAPPGRVHVVARGDTLSGIALRYKVRVVDLVAANRLPNARAVLRIGQRLIVPATGAAGPPRPGASARRTPRPRPSPPPRGPRGMHLAVPDFVETAPRFVWPLEGDVTSTFGRRRSGWHRGIDIKAEQGRFVLAAADGLVVVSAVEPRYGRVVKIEHDDGFLSVYAHNEENLVEVGARVATGDPIATVGRTGRATTHHVHFEIRRGTTVYNPLYLLPLPPRVGQVDLSDEPEEEHE